MDLTPQEVKTESEGADQSQDSQMDTESILKRRVAALIETVTYVLFSYVAQVIDLDCLRCDPYLRGVTNSELINANLQSQKYKFIDTSHWAQMSIQLQNVFDQTSQLHRTRFLRYR